jgi:hypothetical protein
MVKIDFSKDFNLTPDEFIKKGKVFEFITKFEKGKTSISVLSSVTLDSDGIYKLIINGNYKRGSSVEVSIGNQTSTIENMDLIATTSMKEIIPILITRDYPDSLKKVAEDEAKKNMKAIKLNNTKNI